LLAEIDSACDRAGLKPTLNNRELRELMPLLPIA